MIAREYETVYILKPDASEDRAPKVVEKVTKAIERQNGVLLGFDDWGKKKLSYNVAKTNRGHFVQVGYCGRGGIVIEVERELKLDDAVMRHFTVKISDEVDAEKRQKEYATTKRVRREIPEEEERDFGRERDERSYGYGARDFDEDRGGAGSDLGDEDEG